MRILGMKFKYSGVTVKFKVVDAEFMLKPQNIVQLLINLLQNAMTAVKDVKKPLVKVTMTTRNGCYQIIVRDNGCGIEKDICQQIFEKYFTTKDEGMGIGLDLCKRIAQDHGGTISVKSVVGKFTEFKVKLPMKEQKKVKQHRKFPISLNPCADNQHGTLSNLIVPFSQFLTMLLALQEPLEYFL